MFELQMGKTPDRGNSKFWDNGTFPWLSIADLSKSGKYISCTLEQISQAAVEESGIKSIPANTVVMSFKLSIGKVAITSKKMYSNEAIMAFIDKRIMKIQPDYLFYLLMHKNWDNGTNKAVMGKTLNKATLSQVKIKIHRPFIQEKIVKILDKVTSIVNKRKNQLKAIDDLVQARFVEMFTKEDYPLKKIGEISDLITKGTTPTTIGFDFVNNGVNFIKVENIAMSGKIKKSDMMHITSECHEKLGRSQLQDGDILFSIAGAIGRTAIVPKEILPANTNQALAIIRLKKNILILNQYLRLALISPYVKKQYNAQKRGIAQINLSLKNISDLTVQVPPIELQEQFVTFLAQTDKSRLS